MKLNIKKKMTLEFHLDSSEAIMFTKGSKIKDTMKLSFLHSLLDGLKSHAEDSKNDFSANGLCNSADCELEITFQLQKSEQDRYDFIDTEAKKAFKRKEKDRACQKTETAIHES